MHREDALHASVDMFCMQPYCLGATLLLLLQSGEGTSELQSWPAGAGRTAAKGLLLLA